MQRRSLLTGLLAAPSMAAAGITVDGVAREVNREVLNTNALGFELETYAGVDELVDLPAPDPEVHLLNRISFGVRRDALERARLIGQEAYIEEQLHPELIPDALCEAEIAYNFTGYHLPRRLAIYHYGNSPISPNHISENAYRQTVRKLGVDLGALTGVDDRVWEEINFKGTTAGPHRAEAQLRGVTIYRALLSQRQLYEVMVEFWSNHFSIYSGLSKDMRVHKMLDDREVIRPNALTTFRALLTASAKSTAMIYYLDGVSNVDGAPNENYAREIMELHTLGIEAMDAKGGYTEEDVQNVARCFTGWTVDPATGDFFFDADKHDDGPKRVMGHDIPAGGGINDGLQVIDILIKSRFTAENLARKLVRRFVCDVPDEALVAKLADAYAGPLGLGAVEGDIRGMLRLLLNSPQFRAAKDQKFKRPFEFYISSLRATGAMVFRSNGRAMTLELEALGQVPHDWELPTGYPDEIGYWSSTAWTLRRWVESAAFGSGYNYPAKVDVDELSGSARTAAGIVENLRKRILHRELKNEDRAALELFVHGDDADRDTELSRSQAYAKAKGVIGLILSSPYFQAR